VLAHRGEQFGGDAFFGDVGPVLELEPFAVTPEQVPRRAVNGRCPACFLPERARLAVPLRADVQRRIGHRPPRPGNVAALVRVMDEDCAQRTIE